MPLHVTEMEKTKVRKLETLCSSDGLPLMVTELLYKKTFLKEVLQKCVT